MTFSFSTRGERETQFLLCWLFLHPTQSTPKLNCPAQSSMSTHWPNERAAHPLTLSWTRLAQVQISNNCFFIKITKNSSLSLPGMTSFPPLSISYLGVLLWNLWLPHPPRTSVNTCTQSRIVQNLTKPNDKI